MSVGFSDGASNVGQYYNYLRISKNKTTTNHFLLSWKQIFTQRLESEVIPGDQEQKNLRENMYFTSLCLPLP